MGLDLRIFSRLEARISRKMTPNTAIVMVMERMDTKKVNAVLRPIVKKSSSKMSLLNKSPHPTPRSSDARAMKKVSYSITLHRCRFFHAQNMKQSQLLLPPLH